MTMIYLVLNENKRIGVTVEAYKEIEDATSRVVEIVADIRANNGEGDFEVLSVAELVSRIYAFFIYDGGKGFVMIQGVIVQ